MVHGEWAVRVSVAFSNASIYRGEIMNYYNLVEKLCARNSSVVTCSRGGYRTSSCYFWLAAMAASLTFAGAAYSDQSTNPTTDTSRSDNNSSDKLDEIVVTASKQESTLNKTAIAVSAVSQEQLTTAGVQRLQDIVGAIPNVQMDTQGFTNNVEASIRGITSSQGGEIAQSAVATYIDGVYVPRTSGLGGSFYDLDRVEVLRGPQGTLYGRNATAGNINVITGTPSQEFGAMAAFSAGNYGDTEIRGMLNVPLSSQLAVRLAVFSHRNDGYIDTDGSTAQHYEKADDRGVRVTALWSPTDTFKWRLSYEDFLSDGTPNLGNDTSPTGSPANGLSPYRFPVNSIPEPSDHINNSTLRSRIEWTIGDGFSLDYVAGVGIADYDVVTAYGNSVAPFGSFYGNTANHNQYHEINLHFRTDSLRNVLGANYSKESNNDFFNNPLPVLGDVNVVVYSQAAYNAWGVFDQLTYDVTDRFRLTGGIRYSHDHQVYPLLQLGCTSDVFYLGGAIPTGCNVVPYSGGTGTWTKTNWKVGAEYDVTEKSLAYLSVSTGYKAGGINPSGATNSTHPEFQPEDVTNYEVGIKNRLFNDQVELNADVFYEDYKNLQVTQFAGTDILTLNAARAANYGLELEGRWRVTNEDRIEGFLNYLHATYKTYDGAIDQHTGTVYPSLSGNYLANAPQESVQLQYAHDFPLGGHGTLTPSASIYWQSQMFLREFNLPIDHVDAYSKTGLRLTYADQTGHWETQAYVNNLEDHAVRNGELLFVGKYLSYYSAPRTYGLRISYHY